MFQQKCTAQEPVLHLERLKNLYNLVATGLQNEGTLIDFDKQ